MEILIERQYVVYCGPGQEYKILINALDEAAARKKIEDIIRSRLSVISATQVLDDE